MRWIMGLLLCALCSANLCVAEEVEDQTPEQVLEPVLEHLRADDHSKAIAEITMLGKVLQTRDQFDEVLMKRKQFNNACGKSLGEVELLDINRIGSRVVKLTYLEHTEFHPIVWRFSMYRGSKQWRIISVNFNGELGDLYEKSLQLSQKPENMKR